MFNVLDFDLRCLNLKCLALGLKTTPEAIFDPSIPKLTLLSWVKGCEKSNFGKISVSSLLLVLESWMTTKKIQKTHISIHYIRIFLLFLLEFY